MPTNDSLSVSYIERAPQRRNANVQAFNRGKESAYAEALEFCRQGLGCMGDEILVNVKSEMRQTAQSIRSEVSDIVENHNESLVAKLDSLTEKLQAMETKESSQRASSPEIRTREQNEANRRLVLRREEQISQIHEQLTKMSDQLSMVNKKSDMDICMQSLAGKIDLQKMLDGQSMHLLQKIRELQSVGAPDISLALQELEAFKAPTIDFSQISAEIRKSMMLFEEDFRMLMNEIVKVQRHLEIDYLPMQAVTAVDKLSLHNMPAEEVPMMFLPDSAREEPAEEIDFQRAVCKEPSQTEAPEEEICEIPPREDLHMAARVRKMKRVREISAQTEYHSRDEHVQTDADYSQKPHHHHKRKQAQAKTKVMQPVAQKKLGLQDKDAFKERARKALLRPQYNVFDYYHTSGFCQRIARHYIFDNLTVSVVALNAIWIAIDIDYNSSAILTEADTIFQVVEQTFCTYFFIEIMIRFGAFESKRRALMDPWFLFDAALVANMVVETWLVPIIIIAAGTDAADVLNISFLRMMRMVKLLRLSRISRFIRSVPELVIILKAMGFAARSVLVFFFVWLVIIYIFAVVLRQATDASTVGMSLFPSVPEAMNTLLLDGLLADYSPMIKSLGSQSPVLWIIGLVYVLLVAITVLYMLVGCLVEAVGAIASSQKEGLAISYVAGTVRAKMEALGHSPDATISLHSFQQYLTDPEIASILSSVKVDVVILGEMLEMVYEDLERQGEMMTFEKMIELMLNGRGSNTATVRDVRELLRMVQSSIQRTGAETSKRLTEELNSVTATLHAMREEENESASGSETYPDPQPTATLQRALKEAKGSSTIRSKAGLGSISPTDIRGW